MQVVGLGPTEWFFVWLVLGILFVVAQLGVDLRR